MIFDPPADVGEYRFSLFLFDICALVVIQAAMCEPEQPEGHQLGQLTVAASHPGPLLSVLARQNPFRAGAAEGSSNHRPADQQAGGTLEGTVNAAVRVHAHHCTYVNILHLKLYAGRAYLYS